jgi:hypothetical protein
MCIRDSVIACAISIFYLNSFIFENRAVFGLIILLTSSYLIPYQPLKIRQVPYLKSVIVSVIWSLVAIAGNDISNRITIATFLFAFWGVYALIIPFDMRDMIVDKVATIPQKIGLKYSMYLSIFCVMISSIIITMLSQNYSLALINALTFSIVLSQSSKYYLKNFYLILLELLLIIQAFTFQIFIG